MENGLSSKKLIYTLYSHARLTLKNLDDIDKTQGPTVKRNLNMEWN